MEGVLTAQQALRVVARLEPDAALSYQQLRDLERRGCLAPRVMPGGRGPRVYGVADVLLLRLIARLQADSLLRRWQVWAVVAQLRASLVERLLAGRSGVLVIVGARGVVLDRRAAARVRGVACELSDVARGVREAMRAESGEVWTGATWIPAREASSTAVPLVSAFG